MVVLQQLHAVIPAWGNHKFKPGVLCLQNQILKWCWPHTPPQRPPSLQLLDELRKRQIWMLWWPLEACGCWHKAKMLCIFSALFRAVRKQPDSDTAQGRWAQAGLHPESISQSEFFPLVQGICNRSGLWTQECENTNNWLCPSTMGELSLKKLATTIILCIFWDPEKAAHPIQCQLSVGDARSIRLLRTSLTSLNSLKN